MPLIPSLGRRLGDDCSHGREWQAQSLHPRSPPLAALFTLSCMCMLVVLGGGYGDGCQRTEAWSSLLWPGVTALLPDHPTRDPPLSLLPAPPGETWRVMGAGTGGGGGSLAGAFAGGLCGLLVSCYGPVRLTKQGPVKLSRG